METNSDRGKILVEDSASGMGISSKLLVVLVTVAILLSSVALIVALVSLSHSGGFTKLTLTGGQDGGQDGKGA